MTWIKFHGELRQGKHRGIPRALRFVFLELCLEARPGKGTLELPMGMKLLDGVHDLLGGSRREVQLALELYTAGPDPSSPSVLVEGLEGSLRLVIPSWETWNSLDSSAERMRHLRKNRALSSGGDASRAVTPVTAVTLLDQRRGEEIRGDQIPPTPQAGGDGAGQGEPPGMLPPTPPPAQTPRTRKPREPGEPKPPRAEERYREAFVGGIADAAPGEPWSPPTGGFGLPFARALTAHAQGLTGPELDAWIRRTVADWRRAAVGMYQRGWSPPAFVTWLNGGRPAGRTSGVQQPAKPGEFDWKNPGAYHAR